MGGSILSEKLDSSFFLEACADQCQPFLPELFESSDSPSLPNSIVIPNRDQMAPHHATKPLASFLAILVEIVAWKTHPNLLVVARHQKTDVAQAVIHTRRKMAPHLRLREDVVSVLPISVAYYIFPQGDRFAVLKVPRPLGSKQAEERARARGAGGVLGPLNVKHGVKAVTEDKALLCAVG